MCDSNYIDRIGILKVVNVEREAFHRIQVCFGCSIVGKGIRCAEPTQRLYNFRGLIHAGTPKSRGDLLATFDFHLLCEVDFHWARAYHLEDGNTSEAVTRRAEGTCPHCQEIRNRLERQWRYEI